MEKETKTEEKEILHNYVFYTDGSGLLEYKAWGYGYIGYSYTDGNYNNDKTFLKKFTPTEIGFVTKEMMLEDPAYAKAKPIQIENLFYGFQTGDSDNTNNFAEASCTEHVLKIILKQIESGKKVKQILIKTDSQMVVMVYQDMLKNPEFNPSKFAYPDLYRNIHTIVEDFKSKGIKLIVSHVYGHGSSIGNQMADRLAFIGRNNHIKRKLKNAEVDDKIDILIENTKDLDKEFKKYLDDSVMGMPFIRIHEPKLIDNKIVYTVMDYPANGKKMGVRDPDIAYGLISDDVQDVKVNELLTTKEVGAYNDEYYHLSLKNLREPYAFLMLKLGSNVFTERKNKAISILGVLDVAVITEPAGLIRQQLDRFVRINRPLAVYEKHKNTGEVDFGFELVDVTEDFFKLEAKGGWKCILKNNDSDIEVKTTIGTNTNHVVKFKSFIPPMRYFKNLECRKLDEVKVMFITHLISKTDYNSKTTFMFDDYLVVDCSSNGKRHLGIWCNFYSGRTINIT